MKTFDLLKGTITISEDKMYVKDNDAQKSKLLIFGLLSLSGVYLSMEVISDCLQYNQLNSSQLLGLNIYIFLWLVWVPVFYVSFSRASLSHEISLYKIRKIEHTISSQNGYPLVRIHLKNGRIRNLQFGSLYNLDFVRLLKRHGITIN